MTINEIQNDIISEFEILGDDRESKLYYIMELGDKLPPLSDEDKKDVNLIKGCMSKVWLTAEKRDGNVLFQADSNTDITKGLISLLIRVLSNQPAEEVAKSDLFFIDEIGMNQMIGSQRSNGFTSMIKQMKLFAAALNELNTTTEN